jgi:hypothetical protein
MFTAARKAHTFEACVAQPRGRHLRALELNETCEQTPRRSLNEYVTLRPTGEERTAGANRKHGPPP